MIPPSGRHSIPWILGTLCLMLGACSADDGGYLQMEALLELEGGDLSGSLHWSFVEDNPNKVDAPEPRCDIWEELEGFQIDLDADLCPGCLAIYHLEASLEDATCEALPDDRPLNFGFAPIGTSNENLKDLERDGYPLLVRVDWNPHEGFIDYLGPLFVARSDSGAEGLPDSGYVLQSIYTWEAE